MSKPTPVKIRKIRKKTALKLGVGPKTFNLKVANPSIIERKSWANLSKKFKQYI